MSEASSEFWQCVNPACPGPANSIPLAVGRLFTSCPFCKTSQSEGNITGQQQGARDYISEPQPEPVAPKEAVGTESSSVGHEQDTSTDELNKDLSPHDVATSEKYNSPTEVDQVESNSIQDSRTTVSQGETSPIKAEEPSPKGACATSNQQSNVSFSTVVDSKPRREVNDEGSGNYDMQSSEVLGFSTPDQDKFLTPPEEELGFDALSNPDYVVVPGQEAYLCDENGIQPDHFGSAFPTKEAERIQSPVALSTVHATPSHESAPKKVKPIYQNGKSVPKSQAPAASGRASRNKRKGGNENLAEPATSHLLEMPPDKRLLQSLKGHCGLKNIEVVFHVIMPKPTWEWDETCRMFIRFGSENLGGWDQNIGDFRCREIDESDTYCEMTCSLPLNPEVLEKFCIPYKYVVFSPKSRCKSISYWEDLGIGYSQSVQAPFNRVLNLCHSGKNKRKQALQEGVYHQYDTMVMPEDSSGWNAFEKVKSVLSRWQGISSPKTITLAVKQLCLHFYLKIYEDSLANALFDNIMTMEKYVETVHHVFVCMSEMAYTCNDKPFSPVDVDVTSKYANQMRKFFAEWLKTLIECIERQTPEKQLLGAVCMIWCIKKVNISFDSSEVKTIAPNLLRMLCAQQSADDTQGQWIEYDNLLHFLHIGKRKMIAEAVKSLLCASASDKSGALSMDWIHGIPLYSFLTDQFAPYDDISKIRVASLTFIWDHLGTELKMKEIKRKFRVEHSPSRFIDQYHAELKSLLRLDPFTLTAFVYVCPDPALCELFSLVPPNVSTAWLSYMLNNFPYDVRDSTQSTQWSIWIYAVQSNISSEAFQCTVDSQSSVLLETVRSLFKQLPACVRSSQKDCVAVIVAAASLLCATLQYIHDTVQKEKFIEVFDEARAVIRSWINDSKVAGERLFGYDDTSHMYNPNYFQAKGYSEIRVWKSLLSVMIADKKIHGEWQKLLSSLLSERVKMVPDHLLVKLLRFVEQNGDDFLINVVMNYVVKTADYFSSKSSDKQWESVQEITDYGEDSQVFGRVLDAILRKQYPNLEDNLGKDWPTLGDLLDWAVWPNYLKIVNENYECLLKEGLSKECHEACHQALTKFKTVCNQLITGRVTVHDLHKICTHRELVSRMCKATEDEELTHSSLIECLNKRVIEFQFLERRQKAYQTICNWIPEPQSKVEGLVSLKDELLQSVEQKSICELCQISDGIPSLLCYEAARPLDPFVDHFDIMMKKSSNLFLHPIDKQLKRVIASCTSTLTIADIYTEIWQPVFDNCRKLLDSLIDQTIKLSYVDTHLKEYYDNLETVVYNLAVGVGKCLNVTIEQTRLRMPLWNIHQYWRACEYHTGAQLFLRLREMLQLNGDFKLVERLSSQLSRSMNDQPLMSLDSNLVETGFFLKEIMDDSLKTTCLECFIKCQEIISWLKEFKEGVKDIQGFVTVALATAAGGEGDLVHDKLSHLRTIGSGFASLIYEVEENDGYKQLMARCQSLWRALEKNRKLPDILLSCNRNLKWYKSVRDTQGSVERTSFGQMTFILKYGTYRVGLKKRTPGQTVHNLITVTLTERYQKLIKTKYTLDELRDLESKLVLICGNKAEARAEVDHYLNLLHKATRIAELYLELQRAGDVTYSTACLKFKCAVYDVPQPGHKDQKFNESKAKARVIELQEYTKKIDRILLSWNLSVDEAREKYYELNYFTTLQLLELRKELGLHIQQTTAFYSVKPSVLMLLQSISPEISTTLVLNTLHTEQEVSPPIKAELTSETESDTESESVNISEESLTSSSEPALSDKPSVTYDELNESQKLVYTHCVAFLGHSANFVLRAFQVCGLQVNQYDMEGYCEKHADSDSSDDEEAEDHNELIIVSDTLIYDPESSNYEDMDTADTIFLQNSSTIEKEDSMAVSENTESVVTLHRRSIDGTHPDVKHLVSAGYDPEASVEAIRKHKNRSDAMKHLDEEGDSMSKEQNKPTTRNEREVQSDTEIDDLKPIVEEHDPDAGKNHLELDQLGRVLQAMSEQVQEPVREQRTFSPGLFKAGLPNLVVTSSDNVLRCVLALYSINTELPLPTSEEVLLCTSTTSAEEVNIFWRRAINDPGFKRIFCLAHAEKLSFQVCDTALRYLTRLTQGKNNYRLVIICTKENEERSQIISRLHRFKRPIVPTLKENQCRRYLKTHFILPADEDTTSKQCASLVDPEKSCVRVVSSTRSGMGKSLYISRRVQQLIQVTSNQDICVTIPIHGPNVTSDVVLDFFNKHANRSTSTLYHLDIAPRVLEEVDCLLFSLLVLKGLSDSRGNVWRCHPDQLYMVEVTLPEKKVVGGGSQIVFLLNLLPTIRCVSPRDVQLQKNITGEGVLGMDEEVFNSSAVQRVYQYLKRHSTDQNLDTFSFNQDIVEGNTRDFLEVILCECGVQDPSWREIHHFTSFLDIQLHSCETSEFCDESLTGDIFSGLKGFMIKFMIRMSRDFSTPSLEGVLAQETSITLENNQLDQYRIVERRKWEQTSHPYIFFNNDRTSLTFVGFMVTWRGDLTDPIGTTIEQSIMQPLLYGGLVQNGVNFSEDHRGWNKEQMIRKLATVMGLEYLHDPDSSYVLTTDNLVKMLAIQMRFRCDIPVVIMGETGCGKTRLIRYMCDLARNARDVKNMFILKIHGGITGQHILKVVEDAEREAQINKTVDSNLDTVVFFDEANTTESIGLIKEIMCDRRINGRAVSKDLKFITACNPYRKHSEEMIDKLKKAGLGFYVRETLQKLGEIPLRELVYRVLDIPPSMRPLVYDFGQLNLGTEYDYTLQIVKDHMQEHPVLHTESFIVISAISAVLAASQKYMREQENECSFVSLRDVKRAMIVFEYFFEKMSTVFAQLIDNRAAKEYRDQYEVGSDDPVRVSEKTVTKASLPPPPKSLPESPDNLTRALILSLSVCYLARLQERKQYEELISKYFKSPLSLPGGAQQLRNEIKWCQEGLLDNMVLRSNIAKNAALRENVFMMVICIELRIPLFLVGKPGSSKSLAKSIIQESMHGQGSTCPLLKEFKQVQMFSYQCSQLSTSESIIEVFKSAKRFQSNQDMKQYVSVVVLDEVGLAEDSPSLPLKALHPLLEDGTEGSGKNHQDQIVEREKRVAFIGISNWALDPAKMNRGVMVTRGEPGLSELQLSAHGICSTKDNDPIREQLQRYFQPLSHAYMKVCKKQTRQFFGLRDFYSLIKMLYWMCKKCKGHPLSWLQLEYAIKRNFGGLDEFSCLDPLEEFQNTIGAIEKSDHELDKELTSILNPDCDIIESCLHNKGTSDDEENRYLLFLTENYAALDILKYYLNRSRSKDLTSQPYILFGSSFPKDREYTQVCRNINQIKICMETGRTVILLNLENLYESLYDVLNQYYIYFGGRRYVDLGLQTHRVKCRVDDNFRLILIAEKDTVYNKFPTPLINRLEKHFVLTSSVLKKWQHEVLRKFKKWLETFSHTRDIRGNQFKEVHAFIGYQKGTPAAVIFQATNMLEKIVQSQEVLSSKACSHLLRAGILSSDLVQIPSKGKEDSPIWSELVLKMSQFLILQTAVDDAMVRLQQSACTDAEVKELMTLYYTHQHHRSISEFLQHECDCGHETYMQVTTHSPLMTMEELETLSNSKSFSFNFAHFNLHEFDTELDFSNKIGPVFFREETQSEAKPFLVVVQCDSGHLNCDLIACARYRICDEAIKAKSGSDLKGTITHLLFIIRIPQQEVESQFAGFQGDPWISVHIDELRHTFEATVQPDQAITVKISELFIGKHDVKRQGYHHYLRMKTLDDNTKLEELEEGVKSFEPAHDEYKSKQPAEVDTKEKSQTSEELTFSGENICEPLTDELFSQCPLGKDPGIEPISSQSDFQPVSVLIAPKKEAWVEVEERVPFQAQHVRLLGCVQAAVSMLNDCKGDRSMNRIEKLLCLMPKSSKDQPGETNFYTILVKLVHMALKQREEDRIDERDWVLMEARNGVKLQSGGTFRNVLVRRIDEVITPYFAQIIAHIDQNCNIDLLDSESQATPLSQFWLKLFDVYCGMIDFNSPVTGKITTKLNFCCKLPFSWLVKETVDAHVTTDQRSIVQSIKQDDMHYAVTRCVESLKLTEVGDILNRVSEDNAECFYYFYLYDFVHYVYKSSHGGDLARIEYKLVMDALDVITQNPDQYLAKSLPHKIVALHLAYNQCSSEVFQFRLLIQHRPAVLKTLSGTVFDTNTDRVFTLHFRAVERVLESDHEGDPTSKNLIGLNPPLYKENQVDVTENIKRWVNHVRLSQNVIDTILNSNIKTEAADRARLMWQRVQALKIFAERVYIPFSKVDGMHFVIRRLDITLENSNFLTKDTLDGVKQFLYVKMFTVKQLKGIKDTAKREIKRNCTRFFIEVISALCFGGKQVPEPALIRSLFDSVLQDTGTSRLSPYGEIDSMPTIRSFLLQLLLEHRPNEIEEYLHDYFKRCIRMTGGQPDQGLCLLYIQCFEDALNKRVCLLPISQQMCEVVQILQNSFQTLQELSGSEVTLKYLQSVAGVRFGFSVVAKQLAQKHDQADDDLLKITRVLCRDLRVNVVEHTDISGPALYLIKLLVRQFGLQCLQVVSETHSWIIPEELSSGNKEKHIDPFVIYGKEYLDVRNEVHTAILTRKTEKFAACVKDVTEPSLLALTFYQKVTLSYANEMPASQVQDETLQVFNASVQEVSPDMRHMVRLLLSNKQGGQLAEMAVSPNQPALCRTLEGIVVHTVSVVLNKAAVDLLQPFLNILSDPIALEDAYLPTMAEDLLQEARKAVGSGTFYECQNGHPYFVGECGVPVVNQVCTECSAQIGGVHHRLLEDNRLARRNDMTKKGYDLGHSDKRPHESERVRDLSPLAVCIVRILMHSAFIWTTCNNEHQQVDITKILRVEVLPRNLPKFFWMHLEKDMECLKKCTGKGDDECAIIVHLVLQQILCSNNSQTTLEIMDIKHLQTKEARRKWEQIFNDSYLKPILTTLDMSITRTMNSITSDDQQEHDRLFYLTYEKVKVDESRLQAHMWAFRSPINLEHLKRTVQVGSFVKILDAFLEVEPSLRATQYLPDIVKLQHFLYDFYNKRLKSADAETQTVNDFFKEVRQRFNEYTSNECQQLFKSLQQAWMLVRHKLKNHTNNRLVVEEQYLQQEFTFQTHLVYLIPTTMREGRCTTALVDYLVLTHNNFIEKCRGIISQGAETASAVWRQYKVPITHLHRSHMIEYEQKIQSIILSHCEYSLTVGKGQEIKYNLPALEKHILNQFIYGKPTIQLHIPNVGFRKDLYTVATFIDVRRKVKPQEVLDQRIQQDIITELKTAEKLRESLDVVEIVMGLLSSGGGNPKLKLKAYIESRKMSKKPFCAKAKEHCTLGHILSLWETISVELARKLWQKGHEPFEAIPDNYMKELDEEQMSILDKCLRMFHLGQLLGVLFEFIEVHVKQITTVNEADYGLVDALDDYWGMTEQSPISSEHFRKEFPSSINVDQAVAVWKHISGYKVTERH